MSNSEFRMLINNLTQDILDLYGIQVPITDMTNVVALLGGRVVEISDLGKMPAGNMKREGDGFVIYIPSFSSQDRKNWGDCTGIWTFVLAYGISDQSCSVG